MISTSQLHRAWLHHLPVRWEPRLPQTHTALAPLPKIDITMPGWRTDLIRHTIRRENGMQRGTHELVGNYLEGTCIRMPHDFGRESPEWGLESNRVLKPTHNSHSLKQKPKLRSWKLLGHCPLREPSVHLSLSRPVLTVPILCLLHL